MYVAKVAGFASYTSRLAQAHYLMKIKLYEGGSYSYIHCVVENWSNGALSAFIQLAEIDDIMLFLVRRLSTQYGKTKICLLEKKKFAVSTNERILPLLDNKEFRSQVQQPGLWNPLPVPLKLMWKLECTYSSQQLELHLFFNWPKHYIVTRAPPSPLRNCLFSNKKPFSMAEDQDATPSGTLQFSRNSFLPRGVEAVSKVYIKNLADLQNLDPQCISESGEQLAQLIWYHQIQLLKPAEIACQGTRYAGKISGYIEKIEVSMQSI